MTTDGVEVEGLTTCSEATGGDLAAVVFACLDDGVSPADIVIKCELPPAGVDALWRTWVRLRGYILLPTEAVAALHEALPFVGQVLRAQSAATLVERTRALGNTRARICLRCKTHVAEYCGDCPEQAAREAAEATEVSKKRKAPRGSRRR